MLDRDSRAAILVLREKGRGIRAIAKTLKISRDTVREVLASGQAEVPAMKRAETLEPHLDRVRALYGSCNGNLVRVHEELVAEGVDISYSAVTSACRRHKIAETPKQRVGRYEFEPGQEMQHDTSPHEVTIAGQKQKLQCASLVLCFSRVQFAQVYERWSRFEVKVFLTEAFRYVGAVAEKCMLDNSTVIMFGGTGKNAVPVPEMAAFADRFGFKFVAHEIGDANRSAHVERGFHHVENNFYAGRTFASVGDLNAQLREWLDRKNAKFRKRLHASPAELFVAERPHLKALPIHIPEVYQLHQRRVDTEGYVSVHTNRYSVDTDLIGTNVEVRETLEQIRIFAGHRLAEEHQKLAYGARVRTLLDKHKGEWRKRSSSRPRSPIETLLRGQGVEFERLIDCLQQRHGGRAVKAVRRLHKMWAEYPTDAITGAITAALAYGLTDLTRIERMILRRIAGDFFRLPMDPEENDDG